MPFDSNSFLTAFGYLDPASAHSTEAVQSAVAVAQGAYGLPVTGDMDPMTEKVFDRTPRCGMSDAEGLADGEAHWGIMKIGWLAETVPAGVGLTRVHVETAINEAFAHWSSIIPLDFTKVDRNGNIVFRMGRGNRANFDGPGGTLAWMEVCPRPKFVGILNGAFDGDEPFVTNLQANGIRLVNVACHEIGHALGFMHSRRAGQLMSPTYNRDLVKPQSEDIERAQSVYGKRATAPPVPTPTPAPGGATPAKVQVLFGDNSVYEFAGPQKSEKKVLVLEENLVYEFTDPTKLR